MCLRHNETWNLMHQCKKQLSLQLVCEEDVKDPDVNIGLLSKRGPALHFTSSRRKKYYDVAGSIF